MIAGFMIAGIAWIVLLLLTIGLAANAVWRAVMPPPGTPREAGCGSCGYELTTLEHGRCSECGADLLKAGVSTRRNTVRIAGSLPAGIMGWTVLSVTLSSVVLYAISIVSMMANVGGIAGGGVAFDSNFSFGTEETYDNETGAFVRDIDFGITIEVDVIGNWGSPPTSGTIIAILEHNDQRTEIQFNDASVADWQMVDATGEVIGSGTSFASSDAKAALDAIGLTDDSSADAPAIAQEVEALIDGALNDPFSYETNVLMMNTTAQRLVTQNGGTSFSNVGNPFASQSAADWIIPLVLVGVTFIVWLVGLIWMVRRRARLIAGPRPDAG
ncbi:MAG: hypothetical protein AB8F26_12585 [Phycisphaerales bacterium]